MVFGINDAFQLGLAVGIPSILMFMFIQIRGWMKDSRQQQEENRKAISKEIADKTEATTNTVIEKVTHNLDKIEGRLEAIKVASIITKEDISTLKQQVNDLRAYVDSLDKSGTVEWQKTKPYIIEKIGDLDKRIDELDNRFTFKMTEIVKDEIEKEKDKKHIHRTDFTK